MPKNSYKEQTEEQIDEKVLAMCEELPDYIGKYMSSRIMNSTPKTRLGYIQDIRLFMIWLRDSTPELIEKDPRDIKIGTWRKLKSDDIDSYVMYLWSNGNHYAGIHRKISCLNSLFKYMIRKDLINANPIEKAEKVTRNPQDAAHAKRIVRLQKKEIPELLGTIDGTYTNETVSSLSHKQTKALEKFRERDLAVFTLMLSTGIRVSECIGLNIRDISFDNYTMEIDRKGGKRQVIALSDEAIEALQDYMALRERLNAREEKDKDALFLSSYGTRITQRGIQKLVKKYTEIYGTKEHITPHKLRKTYGTELYQASGDIKLVAQALGHSSINTTNSYYVDDTTENLLNNRNLLQMRSMDEIKNK